MLIGFSVFANDPTISGNNTSTGAWEDVDSAGGFNIAGAEGPWALSQQQLDVPAGNYEATGACSIAFSNTDVIALITSYILGGGAPVITAVLGDFTTPTDTETETDSIAAFEFEFTDVIDTEIFTDAVGESESGIQGVTKTVSDTESESDVLSAFAYEFTSLTETEVFTDVLNGVSTAVTSVSDTESESDALAVRVEILERLAIRKLPLIRWPLSRRIWQLSAIPNRNPTRWLTILVTAMRLATLRLNLILRMFGSENWLQHRIQN